MLSPELRSWNSPAVVSSASDLVNTLSTFACTRLICPSFFPVHEMLSEQQKAEITKLGVIDPESDEVDNRRNPRKLLTPSGCFDSN